MKNISYTLGIIVMSLIFLSCDKSGNNNVIDSNDNSGTNISTSTLETERKKIVNTYYQYSQKLIAQDYEGALALSIPGSNAEGRLNGCKSMWDKGCQSYTDFFYVESELDREMLSRNYGRAKGNCILFDYCRSSGENSEFILGFYSDCRKINGQWKIDGINSNCEVDWWRN